jgi:hypothetical protein
MNGSMNWGFRSVAVLTSALLLLAGSAVAFAQGGNDLAVAVNSVGGSGVSATANLTAAGAQTDATVAITGLTPGSTFETEFHFGTCANTGGIAFSFPTVVANAAGNASASTTVNATLASLQDGNHLIHIHVTNAAGNVLACGDVPVAAVAAATATPMETAATATAMPVATAVAAATAIATVSATPANLPVTGEPGLPFLPLIIFSAAVITSGVIVSRSMSRRRQ